MKIYLAAYEPNRQGGGWSFQRNISKALKDNIISYDEADIYFIAGASMVQRSEVEQAKRDGKKIVLRVDNIIRNSRNRNTGMTRMRDMAAMADLVVYQSEFAKELLQGYLKPKNSVTILNSVDRDIFNRSGYDDWSTKPIWRFLYSKYSSDETKNWEMARSMFQSSFSNKPKHLNLVGRFDSKLEEYGFDFYLDESISYKGIVDDSRRMAEIYNQSEIFLYSYFNDACSNTLIEALCCGLEIADCYGMLATGGAPEIMRAWEQYGAEFFGLDRMAKEYSQALEAL